MWRHYADPDVAPLCRSWGGSFMPIPEWLHMGDHQHELYRLETDRFWRNAEGTEFIQEGANAGMVRRFSPGVLWP